ncbi:MFS transporter [Serratia ficaria]|uniref:Alpha-ketoglutarate permease n=1 Tax=Serratia ficaria TaxID=61651 RepID=A0A240C275_SERFI|nr:MFS transporter [Serratia ficaria]REF44606.1 polyol permease family [Serratia ficaria]CAI0802411.1 Alpha-ketoglutarate permease [Serratia ficaria]CAI0809724.1 Alpha-ketoglutarate permease [Serratia ficaria]CAI0822911.1 Alpha-ketoglutarate permease [Serratia ficaria]CAI1866196.1 Alpha-ketoglutarate permease [Serratia ficaria]
MQQPHKHWFGLPMNLLWGYIAIAVFMSGDGFEMAFLSKHITDMGFSPTQSALVFTLYGLAAALAAWSSGVVAEIITPQKAMCIGFILWVVMHALFMLFGLGMKNYPLMLLFYGVRGLAYPLFIYSFVMLVVQNVPKHQLSSAMGWFWAMYSIGIGCIGSYLPSFTIPLIGETGTLWFAIVWVAVGGLMALVLLRRVGTAGSKTDLTPKEKLKELSRAVTILFTNRNIFLSCLIRIINTLSLFGFAVIMPMLFVGRLGFSMSEWLQIWAVFFFVTIFTNVMWGILGEKIGWMRQVRWFGCIGCAISSLAFYYLPVHFGHNFWAALIPAVMLGITVAAFVPMTAVFPVLEPNHKGAAVSIYNLSAGLSNFAAPAIASLVLPFFDIVGVVWVYTALYLVAAVLTLIVKVDQPGHAAAPRYVAGAEALAERSERG